MKNFEAYEDKIKELEGNIAMNQNNELVSCTGTHCCNCKFNSNDKYCTQVKFEWLYEEYKKPKIKISRATKVILENLKDNWEWIAKDKLGHVRCFNKKPQKHTWEMTWESDNEEYRFLTGIFDGRLFNFLSWDDEEPTNIKELLENCEVID